MPQGLPRKLRYVFTLQAVMASFAMVIGFYFAGMIVKEMLAVERMRAEADSYWQGRARDPGYPLPKTSTVSAYFAPAGAADPMLPAAFKALPVGIHDVPVPDRSSKVLVEDGPQGRLYINMSFRLVQQVVWWTGLVSLLLALLAIYAVSWLSYRSSKRLVTPLNMLAREVSRWDPLHPNVQAISPEKMPDNVGTEVQQLGGALHDLALRAQEFLQRERDFTRDASHELRTPLTVIRVATDMLRSDPDTPLRLQRSLQRIQSAGQDMEAVIDAFLILARGDSIAPQAEDFDVCEVVHEAIGKARLLLECKPLLVEVVTNATPRLHASPRVLSVMLDHLLSNACTFTDQGRIEVRIEADRIVVRDTGIGMTPETLQRVYDPFWRADQFNRSGKGMGLSIVHRLGERFGWPVALVSVPGEGTTATIGFGVDAAN